MKIPKKIIALISTGIIVVNSVPTYASSEETVKNEALIGKNRFDTSIKVSKAIKEKRNVVIVNDKTMVDALSASTLAKTMNASILLASGEKLDKGVKEEIKNINPKNVFIIGGEKAISKSIEEEIKTMNFSTSRISGKDRYDTAIKIAQIIGDRDEAIIVNGEKGLSDAVSIAPVAAQNGLPILLTKEKSLSEETKDYMKKNKFEKVYLIGGEKVISKNIEKEINFVERISGKNRNDTNANIISKFYKDTELENLYVAKDGIKNTTELIDALTVGPLAAQKKSPVLLAGKKLNTSQLKILNSKKLKRVTQVGGKGNESVYKNILNIQKSDKYIAKSESELKSILSKCNANDVISIQLSGNFKSDIQIKTNKSINIKLSGSTNKNIIIDSPNSSISNSGNINKLDIKNVAKGSFYNSGDIKTLNIGNNVKGYVVRNSGKISSLNCNENNVKLDNTGTVDKINGTSQNLNGSGGDISIDQTTPPTLDSIEVEEFGLIDRGKFVISMVEEKEYKFKVYLNGEEVKLTDIRKNEYSPRYTITINKELKNNDKLKVVVMANGAKDYIKEVTVNEKDFELVKEFKYNTQYEEVTDRWNRKEYKVKITFNKSVNIIDKRKNSIVEDLSKLQSNSERIRVCEIVNGKEKYVDNIIKSSDINMGNIIEINYGKEFKKGKYVIKLIDMEVQDLRENPFKENIYFTVSEGKIEVSSEEALKEAISNNNKEITIKNNITLSENLEIPENIKVIIPEKITLDMNKHNIDLMGEITGKGNIKENGGKINISKQGMLFGPKTEHIEVDNQSGVKVSNISIDKIESIRIANATIRRSELGKLDMDKSSLGRYGTMLEIKNIGSSEIIIKTETNEIIDSYKVKIITNNHDEYFKEITINKPITLKVNKKELKVEIDIMTNVYNKIVEGNEAGQYPIGTKEEAKNKLETLNNVYRGRSSQKEIDDIIVESQEYREYLKEKIMPKKATNVNEIINILGKEDKVLLSKNLELNNELNIPEGKKLVIGENIVFDTNNKTVNLYGTIENKGEIRTNKNDIKIKDTGLLDEPEIKNLKVDGKNAVAIFNIGKERIKNFYISDREYYIDGKDIIKTTDYSKADMELKVEKDILEEDRVTSKYEAEGLYIVGFKIKDSVFEKSNKFELNYDSKRMEIILENIETILEKDELEKNLNRLKNMEIYINNGTLIFSSESEKEKIKDEITKVVVRATDILNSNNAKQVDINIISNDISGLLYRIRNFSVYKEIKGFEELKNILNVIKNNPYGEYEEIKLLNNITMTSDLEIPENAKVIIAKDNTLNLNGNKLIVNGFVESYDKMRKTENIILNAKDNGVVIGKKGYLIKPEISVVGKNNSNIVLVSNIGEDVSAIDVANYRFEKIWNEDTFYTSGDNIEGIELKTEYIDEKTGSLNQKPSFAFSIKSKGNTGKMGVAVYHSYHYGNEYYRSNALEIGAYPIDKVDKKELLKRIEYLENLYSSMQEGYNRGEYIHGTKEKVKKYIDEYKPFIEDNKYYQSEIDNAVEELDYKINRYIELSKVADVAKNTDEIANLLSKNDTISISGSINLDRDITIKKNKTLVIKPGTELISNNKKINIDGRMIAKGTLSNKKGDINIGETGLLYDPEIKEIKMNDKKIIAISNIGLKAIDKLYLGKAEYIIKDETIIKTSYGRVSGSVINENDIPEDLRFNSKYGVKPFYLEINSFEDIPNPVEFSIKDIFEEKHSKIIENMSIIPSNDSVALLEKMLGRLNSLIEGLEKGIYDLKDENNRKIILEESKKLKEESEKILSSKRPSGEMDRQSAKIDEFIFEKTRLFVIINKINNLDELKKALEFCKFRPMKLILMGNIKLDSDLTIDNTSLELVEGSSLDISGKTVNIKSEVYGNGEIIGAETATINIDSLTRFMKPEISISKVGEGVNHIFINNLGRNGVKFYINDKECTKDINGDFIVENDTDLSGIKLTEIEIPDENIKTGKYNQTPTACFVLKTDKPMKNITIKVKVSLPDYDAPIYEEYNYDELFLEEIN